MDLTCIDTVEVILSDWRYTAQVLGGIKRKMLIEWILPY